MKTDTMVVLIVFVTACKAANFPIYSSQDEARREEIVPVFAGYHSGNPASPDCSFCSDFMLEDCICEDVNFCKSQSCYVPEKCMAKKCDGNEAAEVPIEKEMVPVTEEEIIPVTANTLGEWREECLYCENMLEDCYCDDVNWCRQQQCSVLPQCTEKCPQE